jgi:formamidopyrimidine-DNA glycosylase
MPELPDITVYCESIERALDGARLTRLVIRHAFVLRTFDPPAEALAGLHLRSAARLGKRIVLEFDGGFFVVIHLMIAGRLKWIGAGGKAAAPHSVLAQFEFDRGTLALTEAGTKRRASIHIVHGREALAAHDPGGVNPLAIDADAFARAIQAGNHTLKRVLTDPRVFSGIGNAYSDEILHRAGLSPLGLSQKLTRAEVDRLYAAVRDVMVEWTDRLRREAGSGFLEKVTAFRPEMAVHGKYRQPCPACGALVQRIVYADNECNYCPHCQTGGKLLADRALSRLLKESWPRTIDD